MRKQKYITRQRYITNDEIEARIKLNKLERTLVHLSDARCIMRSALGETPNTLELTKMIGELEHDIEAMRATQPK